MGVCNPGLRGGFTRYGFCGSSNPSIRTGGFSSLTRAIRSMSRTAHPLYRKCTTSGPVVRGFHLTATATGPHW